MADLNPGSMKISELKEELSKRGLSTSGLKAELVKCVAAPTPTYQAQPCAAFSSPPSLLPLPLLPLALLGA